MQDYIEKKVFNIFREYLFRDLTQCENPLSESIFGEKIALLPAEAYFLLVKIEEEFSIKFSNDVVVEKRFNYLKDIVEEIGKCLTK
jgi:acyl carrier protein